MAINDGFLNINHAADMSRSRAIDGAVRVAQIVPRRKYTFMADFRLSEGARERDDLDMGILNSVLNNGVINFALRDISLPSVSFQTRKRNSYNKIINVPVKAEIPPLSIRFFNDSTSYVETLIEACRSYYSLSGLVPRLQGMTPASDLSAAHTGAKRVGEGARSTESRLSSLGMTVRPDNGRHFLSEIIVYDLGSEPSSINVHVFVNPMPTRISRDGVGRDDDGATGIQVEFEVENSFSFIGRNLVELKDVLDRLLHREFDLTSAYRPVLK